jgi:DNA-binding NtrC family response regulator
MKISAEADDALLRHSWPGNARELENLIQGLVVTSRKSSIGVEDLPFARGARSTPCVCHENLADVELEGRTFKEIMQDLEGSVLRKAIDQFGSVNDAAKKLGINRSTVFRKLKELGETPRDGG